MDQTESSKDRIKLIVALVIFVAAIGLGWWSLSGTTAADDASVRNFMCAKCDAHFAHTLQMGEFEPVKCPKCGESAGYMAETCYWVKLPDGEWGAKKVPSCVILKSKLDPDTDEKTYCPDCGREVVGHNPPPPQELMDAAE